MEGGLKLLSLAVRIAIAWTMLSLLVTAVWCLLQEVGRRFGKTATASRRPHPSGRGRKLATNHKRRASGAC
jgi:hypothetical protein